MQNVKVHTRRLKYRHSNIFKKNKCCICKILSMTRRYHSHKNPRHREEETHRHSWVVVTHRAYKKLWSVQVDLIFAGHALLMLVLLYLDILHCKNLAILFRPFEFYQTIFSKDCVYNFRQIGRRVFCTGQRGHDNNITEYRDTRVTTYDHYERFHTWSWP